MFDIFGRESAKIMPPRGRNIWRPTYHRGTSDSVECIVIYRTCHTASSSMLSRNNGEEEYFLAFRPSKYRSSRGDVKFFNHKSNVVVSIFEDPLLSRSIPTIAQTGVFMINIQAGNSFLSSALPSIPSILGSNRFRSCSLSVI